MYCKLSIPLLLVSLTVSAQSPDSTLMNLSVGAGNGVPTTTIIPVAEPPIREVDTTYVHTTPADSVHCHKKGYHGHRTHRHKAKPQQNRWQNRQQ